MANEVVDVRHLIFRKADSATQLRTHSSANEKRDRLQEQVSILCHVIVGFNPLSAAYLANAVPFLGNAPISSARFFSSLRIKDWLSLLNYDVIAQAPITYRSFVFEQRFDINVPTFAVIPDRVKHWFSSVASVYVIIAQKREANVIMPKRKWQLSPKFTTATAATRVSNRKRSQII